MPIISNVSRAAVMSAALRARQSRGLFIYNRPKPTPEIVIGQLAEDVVNKLRVVTDIRVVCLSLEVRAKKLAKHGRATSTENEEQARQQLVADLRPHIESPIYIGRRLDHGNDRVCLASPIAGTRWFRFIALHFVPAARARTKRDEWWVASFHRRSGHDIQRLIRRKELWLRTAP